MPEYDPKPFNDAQRELFSFVWTLSRTKQRDFAEADQWIDTKPPTAVEEMRQYRSHIRDETHKRRRRGDRSWMLGVPGEMAARWRRWKPQDEAQQQEKAKVLAQWRRDHAGAIRLNLDELIKNIRKEERHGPMRPSEVIDLKAGRFIRTSEPLAFDAMNPQQKALWARRLLRVVWILTDTADLTTTTLQWLREWKWGEHPLEFLGDWPDGDMRPIPRLWCRVTIFDRNMVEWERLTRDAIRSLEEAETGATVVLAEDKSLTPAEETAPPPPPPVNQVSVPPIEMSPLIAAVKAASIPDSIKQQELANITGIAAGTITRAIQAKLISLAVDGKPERKSAFDWATEYSRRNPRRGKPIAWAQYMRSEETDADVEALMKKAEAEDQ